MTPYCLSTSFFKLGYNSPNLSHQLGLLLKYNLCSELQGEDDFPQLKRKWFGPIRKFLSWFTCYGHGSPFPFPFALDQWEKLLLWLWHSGGVAWVVPKLLITCHVFGLMMKVKWWWWWWWQWQQWRWQYARQWTQDVDNLLCLWSNDEGEMMTTMMMMTMATVTMTICKTMNPPPLQWWWWWQ